MTPRQARSAPELRLGTFDAAGFHIHRDVDGRVELADTELADYGGALFIQIEPTAGEIGRGLVGAMTVSSSDPSLRALEPVVGRMTVALQ